MSWPDVKLIPQTNKPRIGACVGHVHFMLFVSISFALSNAVSGGIWA